LINESVIKENFENWEKESIQSIKIIIEDSFYKEPYFQTVFYNGELVNLNCYLEWKNDYSLDTLTFEIKSNNKDINLKKILEETERGVGSKGINPTAAIGRLKRNIKEEIKKLFLNNENKKI
jgi:hypothetical protein